jgi:hypothetical protein
MPAATEKGWCATLSGSSSICPPARVSMVVGAAAALAVGESQTLLASTPATINVRNDLLIAAP